METADRAIAVGNFDGVHRGHRVLLNELKRLADERGLRPAVVTFTSHPLALIAPERAPKPLQTAAQRRNVLQQMGFEVIELTFDEGLRRLPARDFLLMLHDRYRAALLLLGHDNRFGYRDPKQPPLQTDALTEYRALCREAGCDIEIVAAPQLPGISSSAIRKALARGDAEAAAVMLGHPYCIEAEVIGGKRLGRTIGFPTANLLTRGLPVMLPARGVYIGKAKGLPAMINIGRRPTVDAPDAPLSVEVHIDGFSGNLYGELLKVCFYARLRSEQRFASVEELQRQLSDDLKALRSFDFNK